MSGVRLLRFAQHDKGVISVLSAVSGSMVAALRAGDAAMNSYQHTPNTDSRKAQGVVGFLLP